MHEWLKGDNPARLLFWATIALGIFLMGGALAKRGMQPYRLFDDGLLTAKTLIKEMRQTRPDVLIEQQYDGDGVTRHDPALAHDGLTLMQGFFAEGVELRLVDMTGKVVHRWPADFFSIWPSPSHVVPDKNIPTSRYGYHTMGMWALPDGSAVVNFSEKGTVKMDKCGVVQWTIDRMTHHSITPNPDGSYWIPVKGNVRNVPDPLLLPQVTRNKLMNSLGWYEDRLMLVDARGQKKGEISVLQALFDGGFERELYDATIIDHLDPTHVNDIDVVTSILAEKIDGVNAGDLLVSIRNMNMLVIMDRETGRIKWHRIGPWVRQHDPDITSRGTIIVYNNRDMALSTSLNRKVGSNLIELDPATGQASILYPKEDQVGFYTRIMGEHQRLPNGNRLIAESMAGRVFEIDDQGNIVWEYIKPYDDTHAAMIETAIRYDNDYFSVQDWSCS